MNIFLPHLQDNDDILLNELIKKSFMHNYIPMNKYIIPVNEQNIIKLSVSSNQHI